MKGMVNFDYGVASIFGQWLAHMGDEHASVKYVDVLNDIIKIGVWPNFNSDHSHAMCMGSKQK